jgi:hypothetical protein
MRSNSKGIAAMQPVMDVRVWAYIYTVSFIIPDFQPDHIALLPTECC